MRRLLQRGLLAATVTCGLLSAGQALAGGSGMHWEGPLQEIVESVTGPVVQAAAVIAVVLCIISALGSGTSLLNNALGVIASPFRSAGAAVVGSPCAP